MECMDVVGVQDRDFLRDSLSMVLAKNPEEKEAFFDCFERFFTIDKLSASNDESLDDSSDDFQDDDGEFNPGENQSQSQQDDGKGGGNGGGGGSASGGDESGEGTKIR